MKLESALLNTQWQVLLNFVQKYEAFLTCKFEVNLFLCQENTKF